MTRFAATLTLLLVFLSGTLNGNVASWFASESSASARFKSRQRISKPAQPLSISDVWTRADRPGLRDLGRGMGIVFSPDLSEPGNREFYRALGFAYFQDADWQAVLDQIKSYSASHANNPIETLLIQSHGTNGDALKLQNSEEPEAPRSYISVAALQERLEGTGVRVCLLSACNAGRLLRPENYETVHAGEGNRLFQPATLGIINASANFDPARSSVIFARRAESHIEVINECRISELSSGVRAKLSSEGNSKPATRIAIPEMLMQLLLQDHKLHLVSFGFETERSRAETRDIERERLINRFFTYINGMATNDRSQ